MEFEREAAQEEWQVMGKASQDHPVGTCSQRPLPRAQMPSGEKKFKGQGSISSHQRKMKGDTYGGAPPAYSQGPDGPQKGTRIEG